MGLRSAPHTLTLTHRDTHRGISSHYLTFPLIAQCGKLSRTHTHMKKNFSILIHIQPLSLLLSGDRSGDVRVAQLPYSPSLATPLLMDAAGKEARDKQRRERAREQLLKINQRKREEKVNEHSSNTHTPRTHHTHTTHTTHHTHHTHHTHLTHR